MDARVDRRRLFGEQDGRGYPERIAPGYFPKEVEVDHVARYQWAARLVRGARVLDVASGTGYGAEILRRGGARSVIAADRSSEALTFGKPRYALRAVQVDAQVLPFRGGSFDAVVSLETVEHVDDPERFMEEIRRVLRTHGLLLLSTPNAAVVSSAENPYHLWEFTLRDMTERLAQAGLVLTAAYGQHWRIRLKPLHTIRGLRRLAWEFEKRAPVVGVRVPLADPQDWCLVAAAAA